ncbi:MAG: hypothetical protein HN366_13485 [Deltaproteobacteria bacterium]|jgi:hypothetical protein|nr:hypothetical protein [Deltaproteobacteria bacterium]MBT7712244.1 hypothetical protein [Deltaproteobacteria bacterium]
MNISRDTLKDLSVQVAKQKFGSNNFERRPLMLAVEKRVKELGHWTPEDDGDSGSVGLKSKGLANIDWAMSALRKDGGLLNPKRNQWRVPS